MPSPLLQIAAWYEHLLHEHKTYMQMVGTPTHSSAPSRMQNPSPGSMSVARTLSKQYKRPYQRCHNIPAALTRHALALTHSTLEELWLCFSMTLPQSKSSGPGDGQVPPSWITFTANSTPLRPTWHNPWLAPSRSSTWPHKEPPRTTLHHQQPPGVLIDTNHLTIWPLSPNPYHRPALTHRWCTLVPQQKWTLQRL